MWDIAIHYLLVEDVMKRIVRPKLEKIGRRVQENYNSEFHCTEGFVDAITIRCNEVDTDAKNVDHFVNRTVLPKHSTLFLGGLAEGLEVISVNLSVREDGACTFEKLGTLNDTRRCAMEKKYLGRLSDAEREQLKLR